MSSTQRLSLRPAAPDTTVRALLACGIVSSLLYAVANDALAVARYPGYDPVSQVVSELTTTGTPTRAPLLVVGLVWAVLLGAFGAGVWRAARGRRGLRVTAGLLMGYAAVQPLWIPFPMSPRGEIPTAAGPAGAVHVALAAATVAIMFTAMGFGAAALGRRFRRFTAGAAVAALVSGAYTFATVPRFQAGDPTPWAGLAERVTIAAWLLWIAVLGATLLRERTTEREETGS
ncbi:DUF998 domain-containing protein [Spirilliplanes yamanashiensis]|uniref:DUF998 domain-containing protein n=1 Tax=Spirilliplanes yamanashiensis TaxID=42233 RepID=A0A8J3YEX3_9ACTN|nr:DUF998 domain-containing protein [Spirilliplanes yamanashiensis]MDP9818262.1 hypothetical protein [Spirilliplanes yamanashiensis]GIJ06680.1 hypothetical protein Sya03_60320 [Spirilliplanes yamanashiensis]